MNNRERIKIKRYYRVLIKLPPIRFLVAIYVLLIAILSVINHVYSVYMIIQTIVYITYSSLTETLMDSRRTIGLSIVTTLYSFLLDILLGFGIGLASSIALQITVLVGLDGASLKSYVASSIPYFATIAFTQLSYSSLIIFGLLSTVYATTLNILIYKYISLYRINGYSSVEIGRLFLKNRLAGDKNIEELFENISKPDIVKPCLFVSDNVALIYTDLHYGPFYDTGSSSLPKTLIEELRMKGYDAIVLHGAGSHERNLPRTSLSKLVTNRISSKLDDLSKGFNEKLHGFFHLKGKDDWETTGVVFEKTALIFLSRPHGGIDDLPYYIQRLVDEMSIRRNLGRVIIVDSHNWELSREPDYKALEELMLNVLESISKMRREEPADPLVRYACVEAEFDGIIDNMICGIEVIKRNSGDKFILLYLRGNNMVAGLRNKVIDLIKRIYDDKALVEVVSNDEHSETGVYAFHIYKPISCERGLEETINKFMNSLSMKKHSEGLRTVCFEDTVLLLNDGAYKLINLLEKTFLKASTLLILLVATTPLFVKLTQIILGV